VFFSPNAFDGLRRAGNLKRIQAAFADLDLAGPDSMRTRQNLDERLRQGLEALVAFPLPPHVVVRTRNGLQAVWRVEPLSPADGLALFGEVEDLLVSRFGADPAAKDVTRVLRLPGFLHLKDPNSPFLCQTLVDRLTDAPYRLAELRDALRPGSAEPATRSRKADSAQPKAEHGESDLGGVAEGRRNGAAARVAGRLLAGLKADLWETSGWGGLKQWNSRNRPPLPEAELRGVFDRIAGLERGKRGQSAAGPSAGGSPAGESLRSRPDELVRLARDSGALFFVDQFDDVPDLRPVVSEVLAEVFKESHGVSGQMPGTERHEHARADPDLVPDLIGQRIGKGLAQRHRNGDLGVSRYRQMVRCLFRHSKS
jgi:hypothetical protein